MKAKTNPNTINNWFTYDNYPTLNISGIYQILCLKTGRRYIGCSTNISQRWRIHIKALIDNKHHSYRLQKAFDDYGLDNLRFNIIEFCCKELLIQREKFWLDHYESFKDKKGFNILKKPADIIKKLTPEDVIEIKKQLGQGVKNLRLAEQFNVSDGTIACIKFNKTWTSIKADESGYKTGAIKGEKSNFAKLSEEDVLNIRKLFEFLTSKEIQEIYKISLSGINGIIFRHSWKHLPDERKNKPIHKKLNEEDVSIIKKLKNYLMIKEIAELYNVSFSCISFVIYEINWKDVKPME